MNTSQALQTPASDNDSQRRQQLFGQRHIRTNYLMAQRYRLSLLTILLILLACSATEALPQQKGEVHTLEPGKLIERELSSGQVHSYQLTIAANQYLHLVVDQRGVDVVVSLFRPEGQRLIEVDSPNGTQGPEPLSFIAPATGIYRLDVQTLESNAVGRYEVRIKELRSITVREKSEIAVKMQAEADRLFEQHTVDSVLSALPLYKQVLLLWQVVGDVPKQVSVLNTVGNIYRDFNIASEAEDLSTALDYYERGLQLAKAANDLFGQARSSFNVGEVQSRKGNYKLALEYLNQALSLLRAANEPRRQATVLTNIGNVYQLLGEPQKAIDFYEEALRVSRAFPEAKDEGGAALENLAPNYASLGDREKALYYADALVARFNAAKQPLALTTLINLSIVYNTFGEWQKALGHADAARAQAHSVPAPFAEIAALTQMGIAQRGLGDRQKAIDSFIRAAFMSQEFNHFWRRASALYQIGMTYSASGEHAKAVDSYQESLQIFRTLGDNRQEALVRSGIARVESVRGNLGEALSHIEAALSFNELFRTKITSHDLRASFFVSVVDDYEFYVDLLMRLHERDPAQGYDAKALRASESARSRSLLDLLAEARADIRQGVDPVLLERERTLQRQINAKEGELARSSNDAHAAERLAVVKKELEDALVQYQGVQGQIRAKSPRYAALTQPQPVSLGEIQQMLDQDTVLLEFSLGEERSYLWLVTSASLKSYKLPKRVEVEAAARQLFDLINIRGQAPQNNDAEYRAWRGRVAQADADYPHAAAQLSRMLLGQVAADLSGKRLLIVGDEILQYLPFAVLPEPIADGTGDSQPLIAKHEIVNLPSASTLSVLRRQGLWRKPYAKSAVVFADPVFDAYDARVAEAVRRGQRRPSDNPRRKPALTGAGEEEIIARVNAALRSAEDVGLTYRGRFRRLLWSRREAEAIVAAASTGEATGVLGFEASRQRVQAGNLSQYRIVHFATHGLLNDQHPELSGLVLSLVDRQGREQDGFLRLHEIFNLNLPVDMVVLSACQTGLGKKIKGEGLVGLTRGFMYAGSPRVVASLWSVDDAATAELMRIFYRKMMREKQPAAAALRAAQNELRLQEGRRLPFYWAGFVLQGDWR